MPRFLTFNVRTNVWSEGPPMLEARKCHGTAVLEAGVSAVAQCRKKVSR